MTGNGRRRFASLLTSRAATALAAASLLAGCGGLPGATGGSREPITVMTWAPQDTKATNMPGMPAMAEAYARWTNSQGGLAGHELRVITCNEGNTATGAATCARKAVKEGVAAVVGSYSQHGRAFMATLEAANIPYIGGYGLSDEEFTSYLSYPVNGGQVALLAGNGVQLAASCERVSLVRPDTIAGDYLHALLNSGLAHGKQREAYDIPAAEDAGEYTAVASRSRKRAGEERGCVTATLGERTAHFFDSFRRLTPDGRDIRISSVLGSVDQLLVDRTGGASGPLEGAYVTGWYPAPGDPRWEPMRRVIQEHAFGDNRIDPADAGVQTTWIAYTVLKRVVEAIGEEKVTPGKITLTLDRGLRVDTGGLTPTLRWRYEDMLGTPNFPRLVNHEVTFQVVRKGRLVAQRTGFVDVGQTLLEARSS
ncbi:ABC transporter substrate-binding protein [Streptomyces somaliensis]|uniref:ABC transporter substrate-binding protein n=1 Tax=Streptomyces somaliensis TaxID=78355 RepID=UPI0020CD74CB|nr:ABC transporter substrate-binding protein [Streptomyces somaliensis]MCP9944229.1 ABC transporter substrate-binding protein [Streptomyces somaliensis]MCP9962535.1 ABC transporter substrate-binding protein [Streptomyces somaliensis]